MSIGGLFLLPLTRPAQEGGVRTLGTTEAGGRRGGGEVGAV